VYQYHIKKIYIAAIQPLGTMSRKKKSTLYEASHSKRRKKSGEKPNGKKKRVLLFSPLSCFFFFHISESTLVIPEKEKKLRKAKAQLLTFSHFFCREAVIWKVSFFFLLYKVRLYRKDGLKPKWEKEKSKIFLSSFVFQSGPIF
jgi:hypothetical protein